MPAGVVSDEPNMGGGNMSTKYVFDSEDLCYKNDGGNTVYCSANGCEAPASELIGESGLPLCGVCADVWYMGYHAGYDAGREAANES